jgi:hypothetical protein
MPRDSSGNYTLPIGNPVAPDTVIETTWANPTMSDIALQLNGVVTRDGKLGPSAPMKFVDGTLAAPGLSFANMLNTGIYRTSTKMGFVWNGSEKFNISAADGLRSVLMSTNYLSVFDPTENYGLAISYDTARLTPYIVGISAAGALDFYPSEEAAGAVFFNDAFDVPAWSGIAAGLNFYGIETQVTPSIRILVDGSVNICDASVDVAKYRALEIGWRDVPSVARPGDGILTVDMRGKCVQTTNSVTVPANVFNDGDVVTIENTDLASTHTVQQGAGLTMYLKDTVLTGNRVLAANGLATVRFRSPTVCVIGGVT